MVLDLKCPSVLKKCFFRLKKVFFSFLKEVLGLGLVLAYSDAREERAVGRQPRSACAAAPC